MQNNFSDYIIYADESGDHSLKTINQDYPIFCLVLVIIKKEDYINKIVPAIQKLKFDFWGHDKTILHEAEIRNQKNEFAILRSSKKLRDEFFQRLEKIIENADFHVVSAVIDKNELVKDYEDNFNPYDIALNFCMERAFPILRQQKQKDKIIHCLFEARGQKEDKELELTFYRIVNNSYRFGTRRIDFKEMDFKVDFAKKRQNSTGLQMADLFARPIGIKYLKPNKDNKVYNIIEKKYHEKYDNKIFPQK